MEEFNNNLDKLREITKNSLFHRDEDKLIIKRDFSEKADLLLVSIESSIVVTIVFLVIWAIVMLTRPELTIQVVLIMSVLPIICVIYPFLEMLLFRFYRDRKFEWIFDKSSNQILHQRISPSFKSLKLFKLNELVAIRCNHKFDLNWVYSIELVFMNNKKAELQTKKDIYGGEMNMLIIGNEIGDFLNISLIYRNTFSKFTIGFFGFLGFVLGMIIYLAILFWPVIFLVVFILMCISLIAIKLAKDFRHWKKSKMGNDSIYEK